MIYEDGIREAYEGELAAECVYRALSERAGDEQTRAKYAAISAVERTTHHALQPIVDRLGITTKQEQIQANAARRTEELSRLSWREFIDQARKQWPCYVDRFRALQSIAPPMDSAALRHLVDHEVALVQFVNAEWNSDSGGCALDILHRFIRQCG